MLKWPDSQAVSLGFYELRAISKLTLKPHWYTPKRVNWYRYHIYVQGHKVRTDNRNTAFEQGITTALMKRQKRAIVLSVMVSDTKYKKKKLLHIYPIGQQNTHLTYQYSLTSKLANTSDEIY